MKPTPQTQSRPPRAREEKAIEPGGQVDSEKLKRNQERLNVDKEHKTPEMKQRHRGTFP
jgi:hypothetical protein